MKKLILLLCVFLILVSGLITHRLLPSKSSVSVETAYVSPTVTPLPTASPETLMALVNEWRVSQGLQSYEQSEFLCTVAEARVKEVQTDWSHGKFSADRFCSNECWLGENLAKGFYYDQEILDGWLDSPSHLAVLKTKYTHACIEVDKFHTVAIFGYF